MSRKLKSGYTLIELSIVIAIISFIIMVIFTGRTLLNAAKLRGLIKEAQDMISATMTFRTMYGSLPGDIDTAQTIFGSTDKNGYAIINGNADGFFNGPPDTGVACWQNNDQEKVSAFQELALAGLIKGKYTGNNTTWTLGSGGSFPKTIYGGATAYTFYSDNFWSQYVRGNSLFVFTTDPSNVTIKTNDAFYIDNKIDDGLPYVGKFISVSVTNGVCVSTGLNNASHPLSQYQYLINSSSYCATIQFAFPEYSWEP